MRKAPHQHELHGYVALHEPCGVDACSLVWLLEQIFALISWAICSRQHWVLPHSIHTFASNESVGPSSVR